MKSEYDFSNGERGKFYRPNAKISLPIQIDETIYKYFAEKAKAKGIDINELVNEQLKKDIEDIERVK